MLKTNEDLETLIEIAQDRKELTVGIYRTAKAEKISVNWGHQCEKEFSGFCRFLASIKNISKFNFTKISWLQND